MVILDVQLWELGIQRLHQGLSETILVNTLTDVREFKNSIHINGTQPQRAYQSPCNSNINGLLDNHVGR